MKSCRWNHGLRLLYLESNVYETNVSRWVWMNSFKWRMKSHSDLDRIWLFLQLIACVLGRMGEERGIAMMFSDWIVAYFQPNSVAMAMPLFFFRSLLRMR